MRRAPLDACITSRALAVLGRIRRAVPRALASSQASSTSILFFVVSR